MPPAPQAPVPAADFMTRSAPNLSTQSPAPAADFLSRSMPPVTVTQTDAAFESKVESLTQAGFDSEEAAWALNETGGNVDDAANLLMTVR